MSNKQKTEILDFILGAIMCGLGVFLTPQTALAVPSYAEQTGQPCAACHVGSFGPQLRPFGMDFKLYGYTASDGKDHFPPLAATAQMSYTHTKADQPGGAAAGFDPNDNPALEQISVYYAGRITSSIGAFLEINYDGIGRTIQWGNVDFRYAHDGSVLGTDLVYGVSVNNGPTVSDTWNSTPVWGFPYNATGLAPHPVAAALVDGGLTGKVIGIGPYAMIDETWFIEADIYRGLSDHLGDIVGTHLAGQDRAADSAIYWRAAYAKEMGAHYFQFGTYGLSGSVFPGGDSSTGRADEYFDLALDANYQWTANPKNVASDVVSVHSTYIRERSRLRANALLGDTNDRNTLNTFRADVTYSFGATINPTVQYFRTWGTADANLYSGANGGVPNSSGWITEIAYVPWGKPGSWIGFGNVKLALQYIAYTQFDGFKRGASDNNTLQGNI